MKLTKREQAFKQSLSDGHKRIRVFKSRNRSISLSRDAMYSSGRESFWLRIPKTKQDLQLYRKGFLIPTHL